MEQSLPHLRQNLSMAEYVSSKGFDQKEAQFIVRYSFLLNGFIGISTTTVAAVLTYIFILNGVYKDNLLMVLTTVPVAVLGLGYLYRFVASVRRGNIALIAYDTGVYFRMFSLFNARLMFIPWRDIVEINRLDIGGSVSLTYIRFVVTESALAQYNKETGRNVSASNAFGTPFFMEMNGLNMNPKKIESSLRELHRIGK